MGARGLEGLCVRFRELGLSGGACTLSYAEKSLWGRFVSLCLRPCAQTLPRVFVLARAHTGAHRVSG